MAVVGAGDDRMNRRTLTSPATLLAAVALAGCASAPTVGQTADPAAAAGSNAPVTTVSPAASQAPSPPVVSPAPSDGGDIAVRPGETWIASQRLVDPDDFSDELGIFLVRPDGTGDHQLVPELDGNQWHPAWSPDGEQLAFIQVNPGETKELWVVGADGTGARQLATCSRPCNNMISPDWSPADPRAIYVGRDEGVSKFMLSRFDLDTGVMADVVVREDGATAESWRLSPDGARALVVRDILADAKRAALFDVDLATGDERQLTPYDYQLDRPDWLPDGRIVFNSPGLGVYNDSDAGPANLWVMDADGGNLEQLTDYTEDEQRRNPAARSGRRVRHCLYQGAGWHSAPSDGRGRPGWWQ